MPNHESIKTEFERIVRESGKTNAVIYLAGTYGINGNCTLVVNHYDGSASKHAKTSGTVESVKVKVNEPYFDRQIASNEGYNKLIHTIGHEFQHVLQRQDANYRNTSTKDEREFQAYSWEFIEAYNDNEIPHMIGESARKTFAKAKSCYEAMSGALQNTYKDRATSLNSINASIFDGSFTNIIVPE